MTARCREHIASPYQCPELIDRPSRTGGRMSVNGGAYAFGRTETRVRIEAVVQHRLPWEQRVVLEHQAAL